MMYSKSVSPYFNTFFWTYCFQSELTLVIAHVLKCAFRCDAKLAFYHTCCEALLSIVAILKKSSCLLCSGLGWLSCSLSLRFCIGANDHSLLLVEMSCLH